MGIELNILGGKIKQRRKELGLTMQELADRTGYSKSSISYIEKGLRDVPLDKLQEISNALNVDIRYFFDDKRLRLTETEKEEGKLVLEYFYALDDKQKEHIINYLKFLNEQEE